MNKKNVSFYILKLGRHRKHKSSDIWLKEAIKIGTTNNIERRLKELKRQYKTEDIQVLFVSEPYSREKALKTEDRNRKILREKEKWDWVPQDRFIKPDIVTEYTVTVRSRRIEKFPVYF